MFVAAFVAGTVIAGCSAAGTHEAARLCTPKADVFCLCQLGKDHGTKRCNEDGMSFQECLPCAGDPTPSTSPPSRGGDPSPGPEVPPSPGLDASAPPDSGMVSTDPVCGNNKVERGEACDRTAGCDSTCLQVLGDPSAAGSCPGIPVHLWAGLPKPVLLQGATSNYSTGTAAADCPSGGPSRVYEVIVHADGKLTASVTHDTYSVTLFARAECAGGALLGCGLDSEVGAATISFPATADKRYYLFVTGSSSTGFGSFEINLSLN